MVMAGWLVVVLAAATDIAPPASGTWVVDRTGQLSAETKQQVDALANEVNDAGVAKLAVLVTDTVEGERTPRDLAWAVYRHWELGSDGVLVMIATESRKAEIVFGSGQPLSEAQTDVVMADDIVANMKLGDVNGAVLTSVRSLNGWLLAPRAELSGDDKSMLCVVMSLVFVGVWMAVLFRVASSRESPRRCAKCNVDRLKLTEAEEDQHLSTEQQERERARIADYDVWWCPKCNDALVTEWSGLATAVKNCPMCRVDATVLTPESVKATRRTGHVQLTEKCRRCSYSHTWMAFIPVPDDSSSDFSSSGSSSSSDGGGSSGSW